MSLSRSFIIRGPAVVTFKSQTFHVKDTVDVKISKKTFGIPVGGMEVDERLEDVQMDISFTPVGAAVGLAVLFPYGSTALGTGIFGTTDAPVVVTNAWGSFTLAAGAITKSPNLTASNVKTPFGSCTITGLQANSAAFAAGRLSAASGSAQSGWNTADVLTPTWSFSGGGLGTFETESGADISFDYGFSDVKTDGGGVMQKILTKVGAKATFVPVGPTAAALVSAFAPNQVRGASLATGGVNFSADCGDITALLYNARLISFGTAMDVTKHPIGSCTLAAFRSQGAGISPIYAVDNA